jgi:aconitate hydratase 2/2-methylisocitrate dehydratase
MGTGAKVYLGSAEVAAVCAITGKIPTPEEYLAIAKDKIDPNTEELYQYLNFDQIPDYENSGVVIPVASIS